MECAATSYTGMLKLRTALGRYVQRVFGMEHQPEDEILVTVGVSEALDLALRAVIDPGDDVLYHEPCYVSYSPSIRFAGGVPRPVETTLEEDFQLSMEALEQRLTSRTKALILNYPNNPTGAVRIGGIACWPVWFSGTHYAQFLSGCAQIRKGLMDALIPENRVAVAGVAIW